jgi:hypothetical protein
LSGERDALEGGGDGPLVEAKLLEVPTLLALLVRTYKY